MITQQENISLEQEYWNTIPNVYRFSHIAMATIFEIYIQHDDAVYAEQVAEEAFLECNRLEQDLSHFIENSDISRIYFANPNEPIVIGLSAFECLKECQKLYEETDHAFDVTIGSLMKCWLNEDKSLRQPTKEELQWAIDHTGMDLLHLDEEHHTVQVATTEVQVDLGGFGKGYAVDQMAALLQEWEVERALIHAGYSSVLALDAPENMKGWPVTISHPWKDDEILARIELVKAALSGSGLRKGQHIIDPRTAQPIGVNRTAWSRCSDAATADALSTAFIVMSQEHIKDYCQKHPDVSAMIVSGENDETEIWHWGDWGK